MSAAIANAVSVAGFGISMLLVFDFGSYMFSSAIAVSFLAMIGAYCCYAKEEVKACAIVAAIAAGMYATIILLVYFAQLTTVRLSSLEGVSKELLDYKQFGLYFNYDLLGDGLMGLATFFCRAYHRGQRQGGQMVKVAAYSPWNFLSGLLYCSDARSI